SFVSGSPAPQAGVLRLRSLFHRRYIEDRQSEPFHWTSIGSEWGALKAWMKFLLRTAPKAFQSLPKPLFPHLASRNSLNFRQGVKLHFRLSEVGSFPVLACAIFAQTRYISSTILSRRCRFRAQPR